MGGALGYLGIKEDKQPCFIETDGTTSHELLHTGNSSKVYIQSIAPDDGLWIDTTNKTIKALIDGAWTVVM